MRVQRETIVNALNWRTFKRELGATFVTLSSLLTDRERATLDAQQKAPVFVELHVLKGQIVYVRSSDAPDADYVSLDGTDARVVHRIPVMDSLASISLATSTGTFDLMFAAYYA